MGEVTVKTLSLDARATQSRFALIVGISQPAVAKLLGKGILPKGGTYRDWLLAYCERLRKEASGRGADNQELLTQARIDESRENALSKRLDRYEKTGLLVALPHVKAVLSAWAQQVRMNVENAGEKIFDRISAEHDLTLNDELIREPLRVALRNASSVARELGLSDDFGSGADDSAAESIDN